MSLCKYKNIFGEINTGVHSIRIFNIAIVDVISTILLGIILQYCLEKFLKITINIYLVVLVLFLLGIILHRLFCVRTTIDKLLF
jgi:hypothetical protein